MRYALLLTTLVAALAVASSALAGNGNGMVPDRKAPPPLGEPVTTLVSGPTPSRSGRRAGRRHRLGDERRRPQERRPSRLRAPAAPAPAAPAPSPAGERRPGTAPATGAGTSTSTSTSTGAETVPWSRTRPCRRATNRRGGTRSRARTGRGGAAARGLGQRTGERIHPLELADAARPASATPGRHTSTRRCGKWSRDLLKTVLQVAAGIVLAAVILFVIATLIEIAWRQEGLAKQWLAAPPRPS